MEDREQEELDESKSDNSADSILDSLELLGPLPDSPDLEAAPSLSLTPLMARFVKGELQHTRYPPNHVQSTYL
jgi:hypothetical protein